MNLLIATRLLKSFRSPDCDIAFKCDSCKWYLAFSDFIGAFPCFQFTSFDLTEWRNVKVRLCTWFGDADCSILLSTDHFSRNFGTIIEISDAEAFTISQSAAISHIISDDDELHGSQLIAIPDRQQYGGGSEIIIPYYDGTIDVGSVMFSEDWTPDDWLSYEVQQSSDMMDIDPSSEDELGSDVLSTATFVDNQNMDTYLQTLASPNMDFQLSLNNGAILKVSVSNIECFDISKHTPGTLRRNLEEIECSIQKGDFDCDEWHKMSMESKSACIKYLKGDVLGLQELSQA